MARRTGIHLGSRTMPAIAWGLLLFLMPQAWGMDRSHEDLGARPHKGLMLQVGAGFSYSRVDHDWGLSLPSLTLGVYARRNLVLGAHFTGATHLRGLIGSHPYAFVLGFYGPTVQFWWQDRVYLGLAVGLAFYAQRNSFKRGSWHDVLNGAGLAVKSGVTTVAWQGGRLNVFAEVIPTALNAFQLSVLAGLEWQMP